MGSILVVQIIIDMKTCRKCLIEKEETEFYRSNNTKDGLQYRCKSCQYENNRQRLSKEKTKEYYEKNKEKILNRLYHWGIANPNKIQGYQKKHAEETKKKIESGEILLEPFLICSKCEETKTRNEFTPNKSKRRGASYWCKKCVASASKDVKDRNRKKGLCRCGNPRASRHKQCDGCLAYSADYHRRIKEEVIAQYGGKCQCPGCDVTYYEFLTIDHIYDDGAAHRRAIGPISGGIDMYSWLTSQGFPKDRFQLLCMNCNFAKSRGGCPHIKLKRKEENATFNDWPDIAGTTWENDNGQSHPQGSQGQGVDCRIF